MLHILCQSSFQEQQTADVSQSININAVLWTQYLRLVNYAITSYNQVQVIGLPMSQQPFPKVKTMSASAPETFKLVQILMITASIL